MANKVACIRTLTRESVARIDDFIKELSEKEPRLLSDELKRSLRKLEGFVDEDDAADVSLRRQRAQIEFPPHAARWQKRFERCELLLAPPHQALRQKIPKGLDDFTFYLEEEDDVAALRQLLGTTFATYASHSVAFQKTPSPKALAEPSDDELVLALRRLTLDDIATKQIAEANRLSYDQELWLWDKRSRRAAKGRALACPCYQRKKWSVTFRMTQQWPEKETGVIFLNKIITISEMLRRMIFESGQRGHHGLIVISGRTASCKSQIAQKLIEKHLEGLEDKRAVHFPTFEDPIERQFNIPGVNYTPREKGRDVSNLEEAINNALRQKPAVLFVGETRDPKEWEILLKFAGTGHLVVTTAHAGSLVEAMGNILQATRAGDPTARSEVGERLLAVIHLKPGKVAGYGKRSVGLLIPTLWRRTPEGVKALMAEGLSSLVPNTPGPLPAGERGEAKARLDLPASIGRYWFARELLEAVTDAAQKELKGRDEMKAKRDEIKTLALEWDMEGV